MRSSIANYKESLSRIANEVLDAADELEISPRSHGATSPDERVDSPASSSGRRFSRRLSRASSPSNGTSPVVNGIDSGLNYEMSRYKADILKLQASEAEIKALSFNYAAMLKAKEEELSNIRKENYSLKKNLEAIPVHASKGDKSKASDGSNSLETTTDPSPSRQQRSTILEGTETTINHLPNYEPSRQDGYVNGGSQTFHHDTIQQKMKPNHQSSKVNQKAYSTLIEDNNRYLAANARLESDIKQLHTQVQNERENVRTLEERLREEHQLNESFRKELHDLKRDKEQILVEMKDLHNDLRERIAVIGRLEAERKTKGTEDELNQSAQSLKAMITNLEKENDKLKTEKDELADNLRRCIDNTSERNNISEVTEEMALSVKKLEKKLNESYKERDKALQQLARLKQHLLEKELEDSDKMDEDSKLIDELGAKCEHQRIHILQLEKALKQELVKKEEFNKLKNDELNKSNEMIFDLRQKLSNCMNLVESKNVELLNLQTALGQYFAETEAKERLGRDLILVREESIKLSELLKDANEGLENLKKEKEDLANKVTQAERTLLEGNRSIQKLEEDNSKLRRALEQSMTTLNRMSLDSDNFVDRRIVIKLLVTYFQRNHSKEVLDLMVRMLGFSEEDKQRIGLAQRNAGKGVVRGVLGFPGRLVGGILGGGSPDSSSHADPDNQSFADLWVDFLLKETVERERRELSEAATLSSSAQESSNSTTIPSALESAREAPSTSSYPPIVQFSRNQISSPIPSKQNQLFEHAGAEFSTVPLTSSASPWRPISRN